MSEDLSPKESSEKLRTRIINSRLAGWIANLPPIAWLTQIVMRPFIRRSIRSHTVGEELLGKVAGVGLEATLNDIAKDVVDTLGYVAAMVATYEQGDALPVRAFYMDPKIAPQEKIIGWEKQISDFAGKQVSISDPEIAPKVSVAYRYNPEFKENLSVLAIEAEKPVVSDELYALFTPVAPESSRPTVEVIQQELGIHQVIAVPFFIETIGKDEEINREVVGNLFTVSRSRSFSIREIEMLETFGQQAAIGIHNAKLYRDRAEALRKSEARREIAQIFAKTAFFANTAVHQLNNSIGGAYNDLKEIHNAYLSSDYESVKGIFDDIFADLDDAKACIKDLDDPFRDIPDDPIDVNKAIARATRKVKHLGQVNISGCANELPKVLSSVPVLSEVFGIFFKNGLEAMHKKLPNKNFANELRVCSSYDKDKEKIIVTIEDTGVGIEPEHMDHIFEHRWTTKEAEGGFGFGLFLARDIIVENLGGSIEVNSERGRGTTFYVTLPVIKMT
jgi:signal transduction histidine kinase